jgi:hypothetical protein
MVSNSASAISAKAWNRELRIPRWCLIEREAASWQDSGKRWRYLSMIGESKKAIFLVAMEELEKSWHV